MPSRFRSRTIRGSKRESSWFSVPPTQTTFTASGGTLIASLNATGLAHRPFTIVRTHLLIGILSDQVTVNETQVGALGLAVVSDQAAAVGITAIPTPITDLGSDLWYVHQMAYNDLLIGPGNIIAGQTNLFTIDSKAMRKVNDDQDVVIVGELDGGTSFGFILTVGGRFLIKEH